MADQAIFYYKKLNNFEMRLTMIRFIIIAAAMTVFFSCSKGSLRPCQTQSTQSSQSLCAEIIVTTCDKVRQCENEDDTWERECMKVGLPLCARFLVDKKKNNLVYDQCIPALKSASCETIEADMPWECKHLLEDSYTDAGVN